MRGRSGVKGYVLAGRDAWLARESSLAPLRYDPSGHELVIVAGPVWAFTMCPAVRAYLKQCGPKLHRVAFLCTQGGKGAKRTFMQMAALLDRVPVATLALLDRDIDRDRHTAALTDFATQLKGPVDLSA